MVEHLVSKNSVPRVVDADAINCLASLDWPGDDESAKTKHDSRKPMVGPMVLTPHPGELQRLVGVPTKNRDAQIKAAQVLARTTGSVIVVKGGPTVVVDNQQSYVNTTGNPGMATGGSGDVLTGVITSLLGQGLAPWDAACLGVWVHGMAGDIAADQFGMAGMTAVELLDSLPEAVREIA